MDFTGERYVPELRQPLISYKHWHRYLFAGRLVAGCAVLDAGCGEGYGADLLSARARDVVGVDVDRETIGFASRRYVRPNLVFHVASVTNLPESWTNAFDVVVSFETIEHLAESEQQGFLDEVKRVLQPEGVFVVSTPNKLTYSDASRRNPFHLKEFYIDELRDVLQLRFMYTRVFGQNVWPASYVWDLSAGTSIAEECRLACTEAGFRPSTDPKPVGNVIAICSDRPITDVPSSILLDISGTRRGPREFRSREREMEHPLVPQGREIEAAAPVRTAESWGARARVPKQLRLVWRRLLRR